MPIWGEGGAVSGDYLPLAGGEMSGNITMAGAQTVDGVDLSAHVADAIAHMAPFWSKPLVGQYFCPWPLTPSGTLQGFGPDVSLAFPIHLLRPMTFDRIAFLVTDASVGGHVRLGIYSNNEANWYPSALESTRGKLQ